MQDNSNISFSGAFSYSLDSKCRLSIPAKYRKSLDPGNNSMMVLVKGFDGELMVYPLKNWLVVENELRSLNSIKRRNRNFVRTILKTASHIPIDSHGRIAIPETLLNFAHIEKNVTIIGMINRLELWNPEILAQYEAEQTDNDSRIFEDLANDISF